MPEMRPSVRAIPTDLGQAVDPLTRCPKPGCKGRVKRLISTGGGLLFKGSGFYITDYRSAGYKAAAKKESEGAKPAAAKTESKSDTKPATTPKKASKE